jgi:prefoldin subunit 5
MLWLTLAFALALFVGSLVYATLKGLETFRAVKALGSVATAELDRIATASQQIEWHLTEAAEAGTRLDRSLTRLRESNARLNVLRSAIADVQASIGRITAVYPRK